VNLPEEEFKLYQKLFDIIYPQIIQPEILIYLHSPIQKLQDNIRKRNREYEQQIPDEYLLTLQETYTRYIKQQDIKTLFIDTTNTDFTNNPEHLAAVIEALDKEHAPGQHYLNLPA